MRHYVIGSLLLLGIATTAHAQLLRGVVRDSTGRTLSEVEVLLVGTRWQTRTDSAGRYSITAEQETYSVMFRHIGYGPLTRRVRLARGATLVLDATLALGDAPQLDTVEVRAARYKGFGREGFEERRALGLGKFIDSTVLRKSEARRLSEMLREYGVAMKQADMGRKYYAVNPIRGCYMTIYIDGVAYYRTGSRELPPDLTKEFPIMSLEAIEVYRGSAQIPMEFSGRGSDCGVIVLWTRRGK